MSDFTEIAAVSDVPASGVRVFTVDGVPVALCNVDGSFYAIRDVCTHDDGPLDQGELEGCEIECPRHGARFDVRTGQALCLPAMLPVPTYPVEVRGDKIFVSVK